MKNNLPSAATLVSVMLDGRWFDGYVVESSAASGEFLVEFEDEGEGQAWCSISQPWRRIGPPIEADEDVGAASEPSIPQSVEHTRKSEVVVEPRPLPPAASSQQQEEPRQPTPADEQSVGEQLWLLVLSEFAQLHEATIQSDGCAARALGNPAAT